MKTLRALLLVLFGLALFAAAPGVGLAQTSADKATVDAAKAQGVVGEQADGYLGIVKGSDPAVASAVSAINQGRAKLYASIAAKTGVSVQDAASATGVQLLAKTPPGQYFKTAAGGWARK
jgi:uncharacterized protein YdbL (DUF1318 family)